MRRRDRGTSGRRVRELNGRFVPGLLLCALLLATACGKPVTFVSPEPESGNIEETPSIEPSSPPEGIPLGGSGRDEETPRARPAQNNDVKFERVSLDRGLSDGTVLCILQDSQGFIWFGTQDGLNKYDGYSFTVYRHDPKNPHSLSHNTIRAIHEGRSDGVLWIGTDGGGLNRFDRGSGRFVRYQHDPDNPHSVSHNTIRAIYEDRAGVLWIGTDGGLDEFDRDGERFVHYRADPGALHHLSNDSITSICEDRSGALWVGTNGGGLNRFDRSSGRFVHYQTGRSDPGSLGDRYDVSTDPNSLSNNYVKSIHEDRSGALWIGTWGGLDLFDRQTEQFVHYQTDPNNPLSLSHNYVTSIYEDHSGVLWVGTGGGGLNRFDRDAGQFIRYQTDPDDPHSLSNDRVWAVYQDRSGVLWIGTGGGGLDKFDREMEKFPHYRTDPGDPDSLSHNDVTAIYEDRSGMLWIGTGGGGLNRFDRISGRMVHYQNDPDDPRSLSHNTVTSIHRDRSGILWVGTFGGLNRFDEKEGQFVRYQNDPNDPHSLGNNSVRSILEDRRGVLWIGTGQGLDKFDPETVRFAHYQHNPDDPYSLSHNNVMLISEDRSGTLWIGTFGGGLNRFEQPSGRFTRYQNEPDRPGSLSNDNVASIYEDRSGVLWIGTYGGGLNRFDREQEAFVHYRYRQQNGLPGDRVYGILEDDGGYLWLSTNNGLSRFDPRTETFKNYDVRDGLQSNEFNGGACFKSASGEMFFGGVNGFNAFYPQSIKDNPYVPPIVLTSLTQGGEEVGAGVAAECIGEVIFRWPNNFFEFEFAALSYVQPEKNRYAYMLEGFDEEWNDVGKRRFGRYTNLPAGTYELRVKGSNNDGIWNEDGASVTITIVPPFWETWWFRGLAFLVIVGGIIGGYRMRIRSIQAQSRELEKLVGERTREIERRQRVAEGLREILVILNSDRSLEESLDYIASQAALLTDAQDALVFRRDDACPTGMTVVAGKDLPVPMARWIVRTVSPGHPLIVSDLANCLDAPSASVRHCAVLGVPLSVGEGMYGGLVLLYGKGRVFSEEDLELGFTFADQAVLAIANARLRDRAERTAVEMERNRLARDLHDAVTQTLFSASLIAEALPAVWESDPNEGRDLLAEVRRLSRGALAEMRTLLLELRPTALVETSLGDLLRQLAEVVAGRKEVSIEVTVEGECVLPPDVHVALYRIAQEALNNVAKHAHASRVTVSLRRSPLEGDGQMGQRVKLCVSDDGCGFDPTSVPPDHLGLGIVRERAQAIGATLTIESHPGGGTCITVVWMDMSEG